MTRKMSPYSSIALMIIALFIYAEKGISAQRLCCPNGWVVFQDSCYLFSDEISLDWTEATHFCASHGGSHIATLKSSSEELFLRDQANRLFKTGVSRSGVWFWLGATDDEIEGLWIWYTNKKLVSDGYNNWYPGQPQTGSSSNQDCACLWGSAQFTWHDYHCELKSHVICEKNMTDSETSEIIG